jgi:predicted porin
MAQVTITGVVDAAITSASGSATLGNGPNGGAEFTLGMNEDLGGGLTASAAITTLGSIINSTGTVGMYNSFIGLSGDFGSAKLGSQWSPMFFASAISDPTGRWGSTSLANPGELQNPGSLTYTSPSFSGISISYQKQMLGAGATSGAGNANANDNVNSAAYSVNYAAGGFSAAYAASSDATYGDSSIIAASYDFGAAKVHVGNLRTTFDATAAATATTTANSFGVSAPVGNAVLSANYSSDTTDTVTNLAAMYNLSKRTAVYINYVSGSSAVATTFAGIKHGF